MDYYGIMGVPITFLDKYNPEQFEIIGCSDRGGDNRKAVNEIRLTEKPEDSPKLNGRKLYTRLFIRRRQKTDEINVETKCISYQQLQKQRSSIENSIPENDLPIAAEKNPEYNDKNT
jgi:hypothetical protein